VELACGSSALSLLAFLFSFFFFSFFIALFSVSRSGISCLLSSATASLLRRLISGVSEG
jgi:hypothetical protein